MKKTLLVLLSLAALAAFAGCSNSSGSSGSPDLSGVTDTSASWTRTVGWFKYQRPYEFSTTRPDNSWNDGTKFSLANPEFTKVTKIIGYSGNNLPYQGTRDVNKTLTTQPVELGAYCAIAWLESDGSVSIAVDETWEISNTMNANQRFIIFFDNNTKLDIYTRN